MKKKEKYIYPRKSTKEGQKDKVIAYVVSVKLPDGTSYNKTYAVKDYKSPAACLKDAVKERDRILAKLADSEAVMASKSIPTVNDLFEKTAILTKKRVTTLAKYEKIYNKWIKPEYGDKRITEITKLDVAETLNACAAACVRQHVSNVKTVWKRIYEVAIEVMDLPVKDCSRVDMPPCDHETARSQGEQNISQQAFNAFCEFAAQYGHYLPNEKNKIYHRDIILYALRLNRYLGLRPQEVMALCRDCITFMQLPYVDSRTGEHKYCDGARIAIRCSVGSTITEDIALRKTKTTSSPRYVYLGDEGTALLKEILNYSKYDIIFADYDGSLIGSTENSDFINRVKKQWLKETGHTEDIYPELMRKALAADNYSSNVNPVVTKQMMGHKSENMSANWYASSPNDAVVSAYMNRNFK